MSMQYIVLNCAAPTTAAPVKQPTGTAIRTMLQLKLAAIPQCARLKQWGFSFDGFAAALPGQVELFGCTGAATMSTAYLAADIMNYNNSSANYVQTGNIPIDLTGTSTSGFATGAVTEGTVANYRAFDEVLAPPTQPYVYAWPLGCEPEITPATFVRVRVTFGTTVNMTCYLIIEV